MDLGLKDRVYIVTGATRGLGNATARELVADGAKVVVTGRDEKSGRGRRRPSSGRTRWGSPRTTPTPRPPQRLIARRP